MSVFQTTSNVGDVVGERKAKGDCFAEVFSSDTGASFVGLRILAHKRGLLHFINGEIDGWTVEFGLRGGQALVEGKRVFVVRGGGFHQEHFATLFVEEIVEEASSTGEAFISAAKWLRSQNQEPTVPMFWSCVSMWETPEGALNSLKEKMSELGFELRN
jgi:hypothetical protein